MSADGYRTTVDAVALAAAAKTGKRAAVLDVGIGAGGVALAMLDDNPGLKITGIDVSADMLTRAMLNAAANDREMELLQADIFDFRTGRLFDAVVTNPPYFSGTPRADAAHHNADIYKWTAACAKRVKARGMLYMIVAPGVLDKAVAALHDSKFGEISIRPLATERGIERVVVSARLGVRTPAKIFFPVDLNADKKI
ncbi:MAG: methyltransferase [Rickettsiales bacterium]|nr:methyltransferase [Rickettsiales bacterium]